MSNQEPAETEPPLPAEPGRQVEPSTVAVRVSPIDFLYRRPFQFRIVALFGLLFVAALAFTAFRIMQPRKWPGETRPHVSVSTNLRPDGKQVAQYTIRLFNGNSNSFVTLREDDRETLVAAEIITDGRHKMYGSTKMQGPPYITPEVEQAFQRLHAMLTPVVDVSKVGPLRTFYVDGPVPALLEAPGP